MKPSVAIAIIASLSLALSLFAHAETCFEPVEVASAPTLESVTIDGAPVMDTSTYEDPSLELRSNEGGTGIDLFSDQSTHGGSYVSE